MALVCHVDAATMLEHLEEANENPAHGFALVASLQGLRSPSGWDSSAEPPKSAAAKLSQFLFEMGAESPMIDLVVVDYFTAYLWRFTCAINCSCSIVIGHGFRSYLGNSGVALHSIRQLLTIKLLVSSDSICRMLVNFRNYSGLYFYWFSVGNQCLRFY